MRWQDLIYLKCPKCSARLEEWKDQTVLYRCNTLDCEFIISRRKLADILMDENHILRAHLSEEQRKALAIALNRLEQ
jgi:acetyl-CoA carboxylase beta subunit